MSPIVQLLGGMSVKGYGFTTGRRFIRTPSITSPTSGQTNLNQSITFSSSAYSIVGSSESHASSSWQVATDSGFTSIVTSTTDNTSNKVSWNPAYTFALNTSYYVRVKYKTATLESEWSNAVTFTTRQYLEAFVNGTQTFTSAGSTWTVPLNIGRLRVEAYGYNNPSNAGGKCTAEFDVVPGETFNIGKSSLFYFGKNSSPSPGSASAPEIWVVAGNAGNPGYQNQNNTTYTGGAGGTGGGSTGNSGNPLPSSSAGGGGSQSSGGSGGAAATSDPGPVGGAWVSASTGQPGGFMSGGSGGAYTQFGDRQYFGGPGGSGWYGGGGGGATTTFGGGSGGGGGSNGINVPGGRNLSGSSSNGKGESNGVRRIVLTW